MSVPVDPRSKDDGFEHHDANVKGLLAVGFGLLATLAVSLTAVAVLITYYESTPEPPVTTLERDRIIPPAPRLETSSRGNGQQVIREAEQRLSRYAWIDREAGVARIPIQRARILLLERGWPAPVEASGGRDVRLQQTKQRAQP
ncbi:MAG: hypothetical protein CML01_00335 [Pseudomonas sp.]|nr:hypothetical protein [Pseudomonas sp.]|tara:strand:+ start:7323 stop:7754 length:432 start_codon:yes stop_codon:yes gene_type:complete